MAVADAVRLLRDADGRVRILGAETFLRLARTPERVEDLLRHAFVDESDPVKLVAAEAKYLEQIQRCRAKLRQAT